MILSFALTESEYENGRKSVTRRFFHPRQTALWQKQWDDGKLIHDAWNKVPYAGGRRMLTYPQFMLTTRPYLEPLRDMPEEDLEAEGGMCDTLDAFYQLVGKPLDAVATVIRFSQLATRPVVVTGRWGVRLYSTRTRLLWPVHCQLSATAVGETVGFTVTMNSPVVHVTSEARREHPDAPDGSAVATMGIVNALSLAEQRARELLFDELKYGRHGRE